MHSIPVIFWNTRHLEDGFMKVQNNYKKKKKLNKMIVPLSKDSVAQPLDSISAIKRFLLLSVSLLHPSTAVPAPGERTAPVV